MSRLLLCRKMTSEHSPKCTFPSCIWDGLLEDPCPSSSIYLSRRNPKKADKGSLIKSITSFWVWKAQHGLDRGDNEAGTAIHEDILDSSKAAPSPQPPRPALLTPKFLARAKMRPEVCAAPSLASTLSFCLASAFIDVGGLLYA